MTQALESLNEMYKILRGLSGNGLSADFFEKQTQNYNLILLELNRIPELSRNVEGLQSQVEALKPAGE